MVALCVLTAVFSLSSLSLSRPPLFAISLFLSVFPLSPLRLAVTTRSGAKEQATVDAHCGTLRFF